METLCPSLNFSAINGRKPASKIIPNLLAFMIPLNMILLVAPCAEIPLKCVFSMDASHAALISVAATACGNTLCYDVPTALNFHQ